MTRHLLRLDTASDASLPKAQSICNPVMRICALSEVEAEKAASKKSYRRLVTFGFQDKANLHNVLGTHDRGPISGDVLALPDTGASFDPLLVAVSQYEKCRNCWRLADLFAPPRLARDKGTAWIRRGRASRGMSRGTELSVTTRKRKANYCLNSGDRHD